MHKISVVIPVYKSGQCQLELAERLSAALGYLGEGYEVILVDDGSPDDSWAAISRVVEQYSNFRGVQMMRNCGQVRATIAGLRLATGDVVITMDDDLQHDPALIPRLVEELDRDGGCDCVYAYFPEKKHAAYRNLGSKVISWINAQSVGGNQVVKLSSFRVMRREIAGIAAANTSPNPSIAASILASTSRIRYLALPHHERFAGKSNYTLARQLAQAWDNICNVSMLPLRLISFVGLAASIVSALLLIYILAKYLYGGITAAGWTSTVTLITFFSGLILLSLGVIGEYMVRILRAVQHTQPTPIRQKIGFRPVAALQHRAGPEP
jgi:dolichol-phosphate mannosyltransferase/undecaprenyl-phosphate 4-deoxy-4-formamido-L-arabinose transferase